MYLLDAGKCAQLSLNHEEYSLRKLRKRQKLEQW